MLLADRFGNIKLMRQHAVKYGHSIPQYFDITNVASMYFRDNTLDGERLTEDVFKDFPTLVPPYTSTWMEFKITKEIKDSLLKNFFKLEEGTKDWSELSSQFFIGMGAMIFSQRIEDGQEPIVRHEDTIRGVIKEILIQDKFSSIYNAPELPRIFPARMPKWMVAVTVETFFDGVAERRSAGVISCYLDDKGKYIENTIRMVMRKLDFSESVILTDLTRIMSPVYYALSLLHCRNIKPVEQKPNAKVEKKRVKTGKEPAVIYKVLNIHPGLPRSGGGEKGDSGIVLRSHLRRGHWKHYREEKPLFGRKGLHGYFWIEDTTINKDSYESVEKSYKVFDRVTSVDK